MSAGYLYCFENESMPGLYKVGMTTREIKYRLQEANLTDTYKPPTPYILCLEKRVNDVRKAETFVHNYLESYGTRVNKRREFFRVSLDTVRKAFELVEQENDRCIICQEEGTHNNYLTENTACTCKYYYHETCFPKERRKKCPLCSRDIQKDHVAIRVQPPMTNSRLGPGQPIRLPATAPPIVTNRIPLLSSSPTTIQRATPRPMDTKSALKLIGILCALGIIIAFVIITVYTNSMRT